MVCLRPGRRPQRWKIRVLCCARGVLLRHWWGVREHHAPTDARGTGWLGIGTEHALHTHTHYTHTHTHAHTGTHAQPHTHTHCTHAHTHARQHRPGTHGVLPGCSRGAPRVRMSAPQVPLHRIRPYCYRGCGRAHAERPEPTSLLTASAPRVPLKFARVPSCGNQSVVSAEVWEGPCEYP